LVVAAIVSGADSVRAQEPGDQESASGRFEGQEVKVPHLGEHLFVPNSFVPDVFLTSYVRNSLGLGQALDIKTPLIIINDEPVIGLQGDLLFASLEIEYQQAIKSWIAARGRITILGRLGTDVQSFLADGVTTSGGFEFGWLIKLWKTKKIMLSGDLSLANGTFTTLNVTGFVEDIVNGISPSLVRKTPAIRASGGLRFAWAASRLFGLTMMVAPGYGESIDRFSADKIFVASAATLDFDINTVTPIPIGIAAGYRFDTFPEGGEDITNAEHAGMLRFAYNGRPDFSLGLELSWGRIDSQNLLDPLNVAIAALDFRYFF
jgi:hypothetical protein